MLESGFSYQIRKDLKEVYGDKIHINLIHDMAKTGKKCYDFYFNYQDHLGAIEAKLIKGHTFNLVNHVKIHQPECLLEVKRSGGSGLFLVCFWNHKKSFAFDVEMFYILKDKYGEAIKFDILMELSLLEKKKVYMIDRKKINNETRWEVEELINATKNL
jgi:penicillin-binding protein-related factor A (putative recombinase)